MANAEGKSVPQPTWRSTLEPADAAAVRALVTDTGFFSAQEVQIAVELVEETLARGADSGYAFVFAELDDKPVAYSCYGPIPGTQSSYDLYWIVVAPRQQRLGLGKQLLLRTEQLASAAQASLMFVETSGRAQYAPTRAFYERMGYRREATLADFYASGDDKVIYRKRLRPDPG
jgi:ribosomal protein S18 acetylase RimI-like enzyme